MGDWALSLFLRTPRRLLLALAASVVGVSVTRTHRSADAYCQSVGAGCSAVGLCCPGALCHVSAINPNIGICVATADPGAVGLVVHAPGEPLPSGGEITPAQPTVTPRPTRVPRAAQPTPTPGPASPHDLRIKVDCGALPEELRLHNDGTMWVQVVRVSGVGGATGTFEAQEYLSPGDRITYLTGIPSGDTELNTPMFPAGPWDREGIVVEVLALDEQGGSPVEQPPMLAFRGYCSGRRSKDVTDVWIPAP